MCLRCNGICASGDLWLGVKPRDRMWYVKLRISVTLPLADWFSWGSCHASITRENDSWNKEQEKPWVFVSSLFTEESIELKIVNSTSWEAEKDYPPNVWASSCLSGKTGLCESSILCNLLTVFETEGKSSNFNLNRIKYLINESFKNFNKTVLQREKSSCFNLTMKARYFRHVLRMWARDYTRTHPV